jgi:HTH-type transcriptional regulator, pleiotropic regulator of extracellular virulence genes
MKAGFMPEEHTFFQRYQSPNPVALVQKIERDSAALVLTKDEQARIELISRIGSNYTNLWQEERAVPILERALALAQQVGNNRIEIVSLISLATAQQYCGNRNLAETLFQEALQKMQEYNQLSYEDVALHHLGRCLVEQGKLSEALNCFERALVLRKEKGDKLFIASTQRAIDAVRAMHS